MTAVSQEWNRSSRGDGPRPSFAGPLLKVEDLQTHLYTEEGLQKPVDGVSFEVDAGETLGLVGESGCGKTMTALSIMGVVPDPPGRIVGGTVVLDGEDLLQLSDRQLRRRRSAVVGMLFQDAATALNPTLSIGTQITETMRYHLRLSKADANKRAVEILDRVGVPSAQQRLNNYPHQFSGGMRQRVMLAIAISCNPKLLIADEPTTALDVTVQAELLDLIKELAREMGMAVIWITHDLGVVAELCDRVMVMYAGHVVETGVVAEVFKRPAHPYTLALRGAVPTAELPWRSKLATIHGLPPNLARMPSGCPFSPRCSYSTAECLEARPELEQILPGRQTACWHPRHEVVPRAAGDSDVETGAAFQP